MCCYAKRKTLRELKARMKPGRYYKFWKTLKKDGRAAFVWYYYGPGEHTSSGGKHYDPDTPTGIHVFLTRSAARRDAWHGRRVMPVWAKREDLVTAGNSLREGKGKDQAVFRRVTIRASDWAKVYRKTTAKERRAILDAGGRVKNWRAKR